jgi:hypothetical protein
MLKKMMVTLLFIVLMIGFSYPALATAPSFPLGNTGWMIGGNIKATINFPNLVSLSLALPNLGYLWTQFGIGEAFQFNGDGTFEDLILLLIPSLVPNTTVPLPTWTQNGSNFTVDLTDLSLALGTALQNSLGGLATVDSTPVTSSFTGKVASNGTSISGKVNIAYKISIDIGTATPITGTLSVTMSYKGSPATQAQVQAVESELYKAQSGKSSEVLSAIKEVL